MRIIRLAAALFVILFLPACSMMGMGEAEEEIFVGGMTYYVDSNLDFSWAYPESWERSAGPGPSSVHWSASLPEADEETIRVEVTALPPSRAAGGYSTLMRNFTLARANFTLTAERDIELGDGTPVLEILGHTPSRSFLACFVTSRRRAFTLAFSLPPEHLHRYLPLFREMIRGFRVLE